jgi:periplasmic protein TonB
MSVPDLPLWPPWANGELPRPSGPGPLPRTRVGRLSRRARERGPMVVSALLHASAVLILFLLMREPDHPPPVVTPPGVAVVFQSSGNEQQALPNGSEAPSRPGPPAPPAPPAPPRAAPIPTPPAPPAPPPPAPPIPVPPAPPVPEQPAPPPPAPPQAAVPAPTPPAPPPPTESLPVPPEPAPAVPTVPPEVRLPTPEQAPSGPTLPAPVPIPQAPQIPLPPVPPRPRPAPVRPRVPANPLSAYGIPLTGAWHLDHNGGGGAAEARRGAFNLASPNANLQSKDAPGDWLNELGEWIQSHGYYPREAAENGQQGEVTVAIVVDRYGHVRSVRLERSARSPFLDMALQGMFRGQTVPPFPGGEGPDQTTVHVTINYVLVDR